MSEFSVRSDSVDVEQIMRQIRARIREKRGVDYTEEEIRELANVKLEKFLDPKGVRSDLLQQFRQDPRVVDDGRATSRSRTRTIYASSAAAAAVHPEALEPDPQTVLQPQPGDRGASHPGAPERVLQPGGGALVRADAQPGCGAHENDHRSPAT